MTLYELTGEFAELYQMLEELPEGDETGEKAFSDTLEMVNLDIADKADGYGKVIKAIDAEIGAIREEEKRLAARRKSLEGSVERLKDRLRDALVFMAEVSGEKPTVKGTLFTMSLRKSETVTVREGTDLSKIDPAFVKTTYAADKTAIKDFIKLGGELDFAALETRQNLQIR